MQTLSLYFIVLLPRPCNDSIHVTAS